MIEASLFREEYKECKIFKYISSKIKFLKNKRDRFKTSDIIITEYHIYFLDYVDSKFELILKVRIKELNKLEFGKNISNSLVIYDNKELKYGIEIKTESCISLLTLLDDLYHSYAL